ncbi:MAG: FtsH protease activity modulator HflK [Vicinamibacterales bacterium]|jgi:membrane protease subunit HflK|nr:FtsH protease activity modulator HflK [Vicinamibacterales bacterium]
MDDNFRVVDVTKLKVPKIPWRAAAGGLAALVALAALAGAMYQVQPEEVGVILRFGEYVRTTEPGLHVKIPLVESMTRVPVQRQLKQEFGFRTVEAGVRTEYATQERRFADEAVMLTGDLNVAVVEWIVQYRVNDPYEYLFKVRNLDDTFRAMNEAVMRETVGDRTVTEVVTVGRQEIESSVEARLQALTEQYQMGITIDQVVLQDVNPPDPVKPSWDEVSQAQQQRDRLINEAEAEYNAVIPRARGEAEQTILQAEAYSLDRVNRAQGEASRFAAVEAAYRQAPDVTRRRLYLETMQRILPAVGRKVFVAEGATGVLPLLSLDSGARAATATLTDTTERTGGGQ